MFVEFSVGEVDQRMRWIDPGMFWMGSPPGEYGRMKNEGPRHEVTVSHGFWLADTPVVQALWETVLNENPSRIKGPLRPVEAVSWDDCQRFNRRLNSVIPGLCVRLPSEAEWEYACRAGTTTTTYVGDFDYVTAAGVLDPIAWYAANCRRMTQDVRSKRPNPWGLHDMLGSVWEWCSDGMRTYDSEHQRDPTGPTKAGAPRVQRGGAWGNTADSIRAARRRDLRPAVRDDLLGVRLAHDQPATD